MLSPVCNIKKHDGYGLWLDDIRTPNENTRCKYAEIVIARSYSEAVAIVEAKGFPNVVFFDHDLGNDIDGTGASFAKWLVERDMNHNNELWPADFEYCLLTANPVGRDNIKGYLDGYILFRDILFTDKGYINDIS
jgi:hypothetical protein